MIKKEHRNRAFAESVGVNPFLPVENQTRDGLYCFSFASSALRVRIQQGKVASVTPWQDGELLDEGESADASQHHLVGLDLTDAVLEHMGSCDTPSSYNRYSEG